MKVYYIYVKVPRSVSKQDTMDQLIDICTQATKVTSLDGRLIEVMFPQTIPLNSAMHQVKKAGVGSQEISSPRTA